MASLWSSWSQLPSLLHLCFKVFKSVNSASGSLSHSNVSLLPHASSCPLLFQYLSSYQGNLFKPILLMHIPIWVKTQSVHPLAVYQAGSEMKAIKHQFLQCWNLLEVPLGLPLNRYKFPFTSLSSLWNFLFLGPWSSTTKQNKTFHPYF